MGQKFPRGYLGQLAQTGYPERPSECWIWPGGKVRGYGSVSIGGRHWYVHRLSYTTHVEPIPDGLDIDHKCFTPACFNPAHLEPVTRAENLQNSPGLDRHNTSGYRGVSWSRQHNAWRARVVLDDKYYHGGYFADVHEAGAAAAALRERLGFRDTASEALSE